LARARTRQGAATGTYCRGVSQPVDERQVAAVRGYASEVLACPVEAVTAISRFEHGNRHAVYRVTCAVEANAHDVVVRVSFGGDSVDVAQAEREAAALKVVGRHAAPDLFDFRATSAWFDTPAMCMQYLPGPSRDLDAVELVELRELAGLVAWVHQRPPDALDLSLGPQTTATAYAEDRLSSILATLAWARDPLPGELQRCLRRAAEDVTASLMDAQDAPSFSAAGALSLLHGDVGPGNVLWSPSPCLIDWEYTRLGDPADEIAYLFDQNALTASQREAFWAGYADGPGDSAHESEVAERVQWWEPVTLLGSTLWWVERWVRRSEMESGVHADAGVPRERAYYFERVTNRIERLGGLLGL
jgi:aminoglycoside phosphotransferase (APT) family kinase protein